MVSNIKNLHSVIKKIIFGNKNKRLKHEAEKDLATPFNKW